MTITLIYEACDGFRDVKSFDLLAKAQDWAHAKVGRRPDFGTFYAISDDGVGTLCIECGCTRRELFPDADHSY